MTRGQLLEAGFSRDTIARRAWSGQLHRVFRGVYSVGHPPTAIEALYLAAVLSCGQGAILSGMAAAYLYGLVKGPRPPPEVSAPRRRIVSGVVTRQLVTRRRTVYRNIPIATVPSVVVDLAARLEEEDLAYACHQAKVRYDVGRDRIAAALPPRSPGVAKLRAVYGGEVRLLLSRMEKAFLHLLQSHGWPLPHTNRSADGRYVDCRWPDRKLTVELDSYRYHSTRHAWELDRRREREAYARGDQFRRYTWGDVFEDRAAMLAELYALLVAG